MDVTSLGFRGMRIKGTGYFKLDGKTYLKSDSSFINITGGILLIPSIPLVVAPFDRKQYQ